MANHDFEWHLWIFLDLSHWSILSVDDFLLWAILTRNDMKYWVMIRYVSGKNSSHVFVFVYILISKYITQIRYTRFLAQNGAGLIYAPVNRVSIGSDNDLTPIRRQAIIWNNAGFLSIRPLWTHLREISIKRQNFSFTKMNLEISSAKRWPFCPGEMGKYIYSPQHTPSHICRNICHCKNAATVK